MKFTLPKTNYVLTLTVKDEKYTTVVKDVKPGQSVTPLFDGKKLIAKVE